MRSDQYSLSSLQSFSSSCSQTTVVVRGTFFQQDPIDTDETSCAHARILLAETGVRTLLTIIFTVYERPDETTANVLLAILFVGFFTCLALNVCFLPFYSFRFNKFRASSYAILFWASICLVCDRVFPSNYGFIFQIVSFGAVALAMAACEIRRRQILLITACRSPNVMTLEPKIRFHLEQEGI